MTRKKMSSQNVIIVILLVGLVGIYGSSQGWFDNLSFGSILGGGKSGSTGTVINTYAVTLKSGAQNYYTGAVLDVNGEAFSDDGNFRTAEVQVNAIGDTIDSSAPNSLSGYLMLGNDEGQSGTDRGTEIYYHKVPISYTGKAGSVSVIENGMNVRLRPEGTPTWTGYDDNSAESTTNITVGSGAVVRTLALKVAPSSGNTALGNQDRAHSLAVCFNVTTLSEWEKIEPTQYLEKIPVGEVYRGYNILNSECYVLPTGALENYEDYTMNIILESATGQNPDANDYAYAILVDATWFKNDVGEWEWGFFDNSAEGTDYDPGFDGLTTSKIIYFD